MGCGARWPQLQRQQPALSYVRQFKKQGAVKLPAAAAAAAGQQDGTHQGLPQLAAGRANWHGDTDLGPWCARPWRG